MLLHAYTHLFNIPHVYNMTLGRYNYYTLARLISVSHLGSYY
nr:MAG TPA: hypothetical protein [Caudoviricetes sp.]